MGIIQYLHIRECECTDNIMKENDVCTIFAVLLNLHVYSLLNSFYDLMVFTIIVFHNNSETFSNEKQLKKRVIRIAQSKSLFL